MAAFGESYRVIAPGEDNESLTRVIGDIVLRRHAPIGWWCGYAIALGLVLMLAVTLGWLSLEGVGIWGNNIPVAWGFPIADYIWWTGLAVGATLVSALFLLTGSEWRSATSRIAEAVMLFSAAAAGILPIFHLGRYWYFYWLFPHPNTMGLWPQFRSPLHWDFVALFTYVVGLSLFWYVGAIPDFAAMRDRARRRFARILYGILALGWQGSSRQWRHFSAIHRVLAGIAAVLAISVHGTAALDLAGGMSPGWHSTLLPADFVFGALLSGVAMVLVLAIPLRHAYSLEGLITPRHLDVLGRLVLTASVLLAYAYGIEAFMPLYGGVRGDIVNRLFIFFGSYSFAYWAKISLNIVIPQLLWFRRVRLFEPALFAIAFGTVVGMWLDSYLIVIGDLSRGYIVSRWGYFAPTFWDWSMLFGTVGLFLAGLFIYLRIVPIAPIYELKMLARRHRAEAR